MLSALVLRVSLVASGHWKRTRLDLLAMALIWDGVLADLPAEPAVHLSVCLLYRAARSSGGYRSQYPHDCSNLEDASLIIVVSRRSPVKF